MNSLNRALNILSYVAASTDPVTPQVISSTLGIPCSTVYRLLSILIKWEFITYAKQYGTYTIGAQSIKTQQKFYTDSLLMKASQQPLQLLARQTEETVAIITSNLYETICVDMIESAQALRCSFVIGQRNTLFRGASAKTLLAFRSPEFQDLVFATHKQSKTSELLTELAQIRQQGYGTSAGEIDTGVLGVAAPIFKGREVLAVVSVMAPQCRSGDRCHDFITAACHAAYDITNLINWE